ncbi:pentapeptide repeat-containing protein [Actinoplanes sp. NPDC049599]|uniref:pentapeptide repeat-containing protein n=1 Tax=Actinoplanes sp. NPDC049599 TaxID=3363903 RepID=UPI0037A4E0C5
MSRPRPDSAQLDRAQLDRAQLDRAQLDRAQLDRAQLDRAQLGSARPGSAQLRRVTSPALGSPARLAWLCLLGTDAPGCRPDVALSVLMEGAPEHGSTVTPALGHPARRAGLVGIGATASIGPARASRGVAAPGYLLEHVAECRPATRRGTARSRHPVSPRPSSHRHTQPHPT